MQSIDLANTSARMIRMASIIVAALLLQACSEDPTTSQGGDGTRATTGHGASAKPTQVAARVNSEEVTVHQLNERLAAWTAGGSASGIEDPVIGRSLNRLIELTLLRQEAEVQGLANRPEVMRQLQAARAEVLARAMAQQLGDEDPAPAPQEVRRYFDEHPDSFSRRKVFLVQEVRSLPLSPSIDKILQRLAEFRGPQSLVLALEREGHRASWGHLQVSSDQLPVGQLSRLKGMEPGQAVKLEDPAGLRVWWLQAVADQPVDWDRAQPVIERLLANQSRAERVRREIARLRDQSKVEYVGDFARWASATETRTTTPGDSAQARNPASTAR